MIVIDKIQRINLYSRNNDVSTSEQLTTIYPSLAKLNDKVVPVESEIVLQFWLLGSSMQFRFY